MSTPQILIQLKEEIAQTQAAQHDLAKWKLIVCAALGAGAMGISSATNNPHKELFLLIPLVCAYVDLYDYQHRLRILSIAKYLRNQPWDPALRNYECWCESLRPHTQKKNNSPKDPLPQQWLKQSIFRVVQFISRAVQSIFRAGQSIFQVGDMASLLSSLTASSLSVIAYCWDLTKGIEANLILLIEKYFRSLFALLLCLPVVFFYYQFQKNVQKLSEEDESSPAAFTPTPPLPFFGKAHRR